MHELAYLQSIANEFGFVNSSKRNSKPYFSFIRASMKRIRDKKKCTCFFLQDFWNSKNDNFLVFDILKKKV